MNTNLKLDKFRMNDEGNCWIRHGRSLKNNKTIAFCIYGGDLSVLNTTDDKIDFDADSDEILEKISTNKKHAFEYQLNVGFNEVDVEKQTWFIF